MIDEKSLRKPAFDEANSAPVVLADGQAWHFPKPWYAVRPRFRNGRVESVPMVATAGTEFHRLREAVREAARGGEPDPFYMAATQFAAHMLSANYEVPDEVLDEILTVPVDRERTWVNDVIAVANGSSGLKASSGGGD